MKGTSRHSIHGRMSRGAHQNESLGPMMVFIVIAAALLAMVLQINLAKATNIQIKNKIHVADLTPCGTMQGGATDGTYIYFMCIKSGNVKMYKTTLTGALVGSVVDMGTETDIGHANDLTYNPDTGKLVLSGYPTGGTGAISRRVWIVNPSTLAIEGPALSFSNGTANVLCYNSARRQYIVGSNGYVHDEYLNYTGQQKFLSDQIDIWLEIDPMWYAANNSNGWDIAKQSIECKYEKIYVMRSIHADIDNSGTIANVTRIAVLDWGGNLMAAYQLHVDAEAENIFVADDRIYLGYNRGNWSGHSGSAADIDFFVRVVEAPTITSVVTATGAGVTANYTVKSNGEWPDATIGITQTTRTVAITGTDFTGTTSVTVGGTDCTSFTANSDTSITCTIPNTNKSGEQTIVVTALGGSSTPTATAGVNTIVYVDPPVVASASATTAKTNGQLPDTLSGTAWTNVTGTTNTITGTGFQGAGGIIAATTALVSIGGTCTAYTITDATTITCDQPNWGSAGVKDVQVSNAYGSSGTATNVTALAGPTITSVNPNNYIPITGGKEVALTGTGFDATFTTTVGGTDCTAKTFINATSSTCTVPALAAGTQTVITRTPYGTSSGVNVRLIDPYVSITVDNSDVVITITPVSSGYYNYGSNIARVRTNMEGYNLFISTDSTTSNSINHASLSDSIGPTAGTWAVKTPLAVNTWGFTLTASPTASANIWSAVPNKSTPLIIKTTNLPDESALGDQTTIYYGANVDLNRLAGEYQATVIYTVLGSI